MGGREALMSVFVNPSHDLQTFDSVCVHPSHDLHFWQCFHPPHDLHIWRCLCWSISWQYCYVLLLTVLLFVQPSHDLQTHLTNVFISWPADTFNSVCVHPSHDLRHLWQCLCPSISWPADTFDSGFTSIHLMTFRHFLRWALLSLDSTTFSFSIFYKLFPGYNLILMPLFCISDTMAKTRSPRVVPKFDDGRESSRVLVDDKESKIAADQRARNKLTSLADPVWLTGH